MGMRRQTQENRAEVIFRWTAQMQRATQCSDETLGIRIVEWYHGALPACARTLEFKTQGDAFRCAKTNAQRLMRFTKPDVNTHLPTELEEAWVEGGLVEPWRGHCKRELAARYGFLDVPIPSDTGVTDVQSVGQFTQRVGEVLESLSPVLGDLQINEQDKDKIPAAVVSIERAIAAGESILLRLRRVLEGPPAQ